MLDLEEQEEVVEGELAGHRKKSAPGDGTRTVSRIGKLDVEPNAS